MNSNRPVESTAGISLGDIYFVLFRNKWKIIILSVLGMIAAAGVYHFRPPPFQSQAELLIKYVPESSQMALLGDSQKVIIPGNDVITSEIQILTSLDLSEEAVTNIGVSNILAGMHLPQNPVNAAAYLRSHLTAVQGDRASSVIIVTFTHPDPRVVQPVLQEIINDYFQKHYEIHSASSQFLDNLTMEQSALSVQLNTTEQQLADLKNKANIISVDDSRRDLSDQITKVRSDILDAQVELSGYQATLKQTGSNELSQIDTNDPEAIPQNQMDAYKTVSVTLDALHKKAEDYLAEGFTISNSLLQEINAQIDTAEQTKSNLEKKYPQITGTLTTVPSSSGSSTAPVVDTRTAITQLQARIKAWNTQLDTLQMQATNLNNLAPAIAQLEQTRAIQQANYQNLSVSIERSHIDSALDTGKTPNIKWVQTPSPPARDWTKTHKQMTMFAFGGIGLGLAWAFLLELYFDRSVKRAVEIETKLKLPLFLSIPDFSRNGHSRISAGRTRRLLPFKNESKKNDSSSADGVVSAPNGEAVVLQSKNPIVEPYHEALRDRLIAYFDLKGLTHKPKLVAVTSANHGAGVSSLAAGLAASFSVTGDGNVLLVDMNLENGAAQHFYKGKPACGLDTALQSETKNNALVQENLYVVAGNSNSDSLPRVLPKRFAGLVSKFKASEFDYIIFDLPPVSQTSVTPRVARFMDMMLLVIESEKTDRDIVRRVSEQLMEFGGTVGAVLNKTHQYVPEQLQKELPGHK